MLSRVVDHEISMQFSSTVNVEGRERREVVGVGNYTVGEQKLIKPTLGYSKIRISYLELVN